MNIETIPTELTPIDWSAIFGTTLHRIISARYNAITLQPQLKFIKNEVTPIVIGSVAKDLQLKNVTPRAIENILRNDNSTPYNLFNGYFLKSTENFEIKTYDILDRYLGKKVLPLSFDGNINSVAINTPTYMYETNFPLTTDSVKGINISGRISESEVRYMLNSTHRTSLDTLDDIIKDSKLIGKAFLAYWEALSNQVYSATGIAAERIGLNQSELNELSNEEADKKIIEQINITVANELTNDPRITINEELANTLGNIESKDIRFLPQNLLLPFNSQNFGYSNRADILLNQDDTIEDCITIINTYLRGLNGALAKQDLPRQITITQLVNFDETSTHVFTEFNVYNVFTAGHNEITKEMVDNSRTIQNKLVAIIDKNFTISQDL